MLAPEGRVASCQPFSPELVRRTCPCPFGSIPVVMHVLVEVHARERTFPTPEGRATGVDHDLPPLRVVTAATVLWLAPITVHHLVAAHATACGTNAWGSDVATTHWSELVVLSITGRSPEKPKAMHDVAEQLAPEIMAWMGSSERFHACPMVDDVAKIGVVDDGSNGLPSAAHSPELPQDTAERLAERYGLGWPIAAPVDDVGWMLELCEEQAAATTLSTTTAAVARHDVVIGTRRRMAPIVGGDTPWLVPLAAVARLPSKSWVGSM